MMVWLQVWTILLHGLFAQAVLPWPGTSVPVTPPPSSGLEVWWEADVGNNCGGSACTNGASQTTWADQSGNLTCGVGTTPCNGSLNAGISGGNCTAPIYNTNQINGKPAVKFAGILPPSAGYTCMATSYNPGITATLPWSGAITEFIVAKNATIAGSPDQAYWGGGSAVFFYRTHNATTLQGADKLATALIANGSSAFDTNWHQMNVTYENTVGVYAYRVDRATGGSGTNKVTSIGGSGFVLGLTSFSSGTNPLAGQVAEFLLYNRVLSGAEITQVETYLHNKYGL